MSKIIIAVHGIGNKPPKATLKKWWIKAINDGLKQIGHSDVDYCFEMAYWTDHLYSELLDPKVKDKKNKLYIHRPYSEPVGTPKKWEPSKLRKKILDRLEKKLDKIFYEDHIFINYDHIADLIIKRMFRDMNTYYSKLSIKKGYENKSAKEAVREDVSKIIKKHKGKDILLLSHSMGTVVAYDALKHVIPKIKINTFITMGSPMGIPVLIKKNLLEQGIDYHKQKKCPSPDNIKNKWLNYSDLYDRIAMNYDLEDDFKQNDSGIKPQDIIVKNTYEYNGVKNHHKSYGYLRTPEVADAIYCFLTEKQPGILTSLKKLLNIKK